MKKIHIVIILMSAALTAMLIYFYTVSNEIVTFAGARERPGKQVKVVGTLDKEKSIEYDASKNANLTTFYVKDSNGESVCVRLTDKKGKPMGLEMSENLTLEGKIADDGSFEASHLLMKCPSKYNDQKHALDAQ